MNFFPTRLFFFLKPLLFTSSDITIKVIKQVLLKVINFLKKVDFSTFKLLRIGWILIPTNDKF